ncbi:MAG: macro domain-containing protein [Clostridia bacterium]|nr:macro domain-containing protein [Clostridia bacterium]
MPLQIIRQDITKMKVDAIVNTTNESMIGYSGVDLAIHTLAGKELDAECERLAPLGLGEAKITAGYGLPCRYIIHTSCPVWQDDHDDHDALSYYKESVLYSCYTKSLKLALDNGCTTVAFPLISADLYGYLSERLQHITVEAITKFLFEHEMTVYLCVFDNDSCVCPFDLHYNILKFIKNGYVQTHGDWFYDDDVVRRSIAPPSLSVPPLSTYGRIQRSVDARDLRDYIRHMDKSFREMLFDLIDERGMSEIECYKKANVDRRVFSKIKSNPDYRPSRQTAVAFAIALQLDLEQTQALLATVGLTLSGSNLFDKIIQYFIYTKNYNVFEINEALFEFDQPLLGSV